MSLKQSVYVKVVELMSSWYMGSDLKCTKLLKSFHKNKVWFKKKCKWIVIIVTADATSM